MLFCHVALPIPGNENNLLREVCQGRISALEELSTRDPNLPHYYQREDYYLAKGVPPK